MKFWPKDFPLFPQQASGMAGEVDALFIAFVGIAAFFSLLIAVLVIYLALKYRRRSVDEVGKPEKENLWLEVTWSIIPLVILMVMFVWGTSVFFKMRRPPGNAVEYYVTAKQWMWKFQHPDGPREINTLHVPVGQPVKLIMTSEDVIHSFYLPAFRNKMDVLPGRYTTLWFEAEKPGTYRLFCAEYCGAEHSLMRGSIIVMEPQDYERWLSGAPKETEVAASGEDLFQSNACGTCHRATTAIQAPILVGLFGETVELKNGSSVLVDENYIRESILNPATKVVKGYNAIMPTYTGRISEEELARLIEYIKSLGEEAEEEGAETTTEESETTTHIKG